MVLTNATKLHYPLVVDQASRIIKGLKKLGHKNTKIRQAIISLLLKAKTPLSAPQIQLELEKDGLASNKSTIYREITFLKDQQIVKELQLGEDKKRYEIEGENHHHHLVCLKCEQVEDVKLAKELDQEEQAIAQLKNFKVLNHSLEFFGICGRCQ